MMESNKQDKYESPVKAIFTGISDLLHRPADELDLDNLADLAGKKVLITGASSGLGFATSVELARRGAHVIMAMRSGIPEKGEELIKRSGADHVDMIHLDLSDLDSILKLAPEIKQRFGKLDIIICNAAMVAKKSRQIWHGLDEMFVVNYFSKFLWLNHLIETGCLNTSGDKPPRIVIVNSESHRNPEHFEWDKFGLYEPYGIKKSVAMYGYYKLLLLTFANEMSRRLNREGQVSCPVLALCPGPINSNIAREAPRLFQPLLRLVFRIFFRSPDKACRPVVYLAASKELDDKSIDYLFLMQRKTMDGKAVDPENGHRLWELSSKLRSKIDAPNQK